MQDLQQYQQEGPSLSARDLLLILWRRGWVILVVLTASLGTAYYVSRHTPKVWRANAQLLLIQHASAGGNNQDMLASPMLENPDTQVALLQNIASSQRAIDWMKNQALKHNTTLDQDDAALTAELFQNLTQVQAVKDTNLIGISVDAADRSRSETWANAVCQAFVEYKKSVAQQGIDETIASLQDRAVRAHRSMLDAEQAETEFKKAHHLVDIPAQDKALLERYMAADGQVTGLKQDLTVQTAALKGLQDHLDAINTAIKTGTGVRDDAEVVGMQNQLTQLQVQRAAAALKYTKKYPGVLRELDGQIADLQARLAALLQGTLDNRKPSLQDQGVLTAKVKESELTVRGINAHLAATVALRDSLQAESAALPETSMIYARLARNAELAQKLEAGMQTALSEARIDGDMASGDVQIAQYPYADATPFKPNLVRDLVFGGVLGLFVSVASVLMLEQSDRRIRHIDEVRRLGRGPVIGALPALRAADRRAMAAGHWPAEAIRAYSLARANLALCMRRAGIPEPWDHQIVMVTSALPGEGKSLTAAGLARSIARTGTRVVLVDADLTRPTQKRIFPADAEHGVAEVVVDGLPLEDAVVGCDTPNLTVLHAGHTQADPTEVVSLPQMAGMLLALRDQYEVVVVDTPACSMMADALLIAPYADSILQVVSAGQADERLTADTAAALSAAAPRSMAFFVNRAPREAERSYRYYYGPGRNGGSGNGNGHRALPASTETEESHVA